MKVLIECYYLNNFGDDLILASFIQNTNFEDYYIIGDEKRRGNDKIFGEKVKFISYKKSLFSSNEFDQFIIIGGSMFQEVTGWNKRIWRLRILSKIFKLLNKKNYITGINYGPYKTKKFLNETKKLFRNFDGISVRDNNSYKILKEMKINNIGLYPDTALAFKKNRLFNNSEEELKNVIGLSIINSPEISNEKEYINKMGGIIKKIIAKGDHVKLFSFQSSDPYNDTKVIDKIYDLLDNKEKMFVKIVQYESNNFEQFLFEFDQCYLIIGSRLHSIILSIIFNKKVVPVIYSDKTVEFLNYIEFNNKLTPLYVEKVSEWSVENIIINIEKIDYSDVSEYKNLNEWINESKKHYNYV